jgi:hypothetical protein
MVRFDGTLFGEKVLKVVEYNSTPELSSVNLSTVYFVLCAMNGHSRTLFDYFSLSICHLGA